MNDPQTNALILFAFLAISLTVLTALAGGLALLERLVPGLSEWLDEHVGPEPEWRKW